MAKLFAETESIVTSETFVGTTMTGTTAIGNGGATTDHVGFFKATPVVQPTSASQGAITTLTGGKTTTNIATKLNLVIKYCMRNRTDMIALGLIKGS